MFHVKESLNLKGLTTPSGIDKVMDEVDSAICDKPANDTR